MGAFQFLGANVAEHDAEREEAEHADHQNDEQHALRLIWGVLCPLQDGVVLRRWWPDACAVEAVP